MPSALNFVTDLLETGRVSVPPDSRAPDHLKEAVGELDLRLGVDLPPGRPTLDIDSGSWALTLLYRACQALVYRDIEAGAINDALASPCPGKPGPAVCYSVDLAFRFLPDVLKLARGIAQDDPLVTGVVKVLSQWPLSSVGVEDAEAGDVSAFVDHPALRRLYIDRIIEREDLGRLKDPRVREEVAAALGAYPELAPRVAAALAEENSSASAA